MKVYLDSTSHLYLKEGARKERTSKSDFARRQIEAGDFASQVREIMREELSKHAPPPSDPQAEDSPNWAPAKAQMFRMRELFRDFHFRFDIPPIISETDPVTSNQGDFGIVAGHGQRYRMLSVHMIGKAAGIAYLHPEFRELAAEFISCRRAAFELVKDLVDGLSPLSRELSYYWFYSMDLEYALDYVDKNPLTEAQIEELKSRRRRRPPTKK